MTPLIAVDDIKVTRAGHAVLDGVSFSLFPGERLALAGANGAGKTTLLRALVGLETCARGTIIAFGRPCTCEKDFRAAREKIAYLFQDPDDQLFCATVLDDVMFGPLNLGLSETEAAAKARHTLKLLDLSHLAARVTHRLSGGEKRLVSLATILAMDPDVLLLDEPTNGLDETYCAHLTRILKSLPAAMVIVSHDKPFLGELANRFARLRSGRLEEVALHPHANEADRMFVPARADGLVA